MKRRLSTDILMWIHIALSDDGDNPTKSFQKSQFQNDQKSVASSIVSIIGA